VDESSRVPGFAGETLARALAICVGNLLSAIPNARRGSGAGTILLTVAFETSRSVCPVFAGVQGRAMASKSPWWPFAALFRSRKPAPAARTSAPANPFHAVSVVPGKNACAAAHRFTGRRFLSRQAPKLPLPTCDAAICTCRYKHHKDRRVGPRRRSEIGMMSPLWNGTERRRSRGRRADDK